MGSGCGTGWPRWSPQLCVHDNYRNNPFHNFRHCFCVAQMMYSMIWLCGLQVGPGPPGAGGSTPAQARGPPTPQTGPWVGLLHPPQPQASGCPTLFPTPGRAWRGITPPPPPAVSHPAQPPHPPHLPLIQEKFSQIDILILMTAAICHDLDHPGYNNTYAPAPLLSFPF